MSSLRCYVAAPFDDAPLVREVHARLRAHGVVPTSSWAEHARGPERLEELPLDEVRALAAKNDFALASSDAALVLPRDGAGREMYAEARLAIALAIPLVWVGFPRCLSAYREGVVRVEHLADGLTEIFRLAAARAVSAA